jgi:hypothetical protein
VPSCQRTSTDYARSVDVDGRTESVLMRLLAVLNRLMCDRHHVMMRGHGLGASRIMSDGVSATQASQVSSPSPLDRSLPIYKSSGFLL